MQSQVDTSILEYVVSIDPRDMLTTLAALHVVEFRLVRGRVYLKTKRYDRTQLTRMGVSYRIGEVI
jgi:hypothetical protein